MLYYFDKIDEEKKMVGFTLKLISIDCGQISPAAEPTSKCICQNLLVVIGLSNGGLVYDQLIYGTYIPDSLFSLHPNAVVDLVKVIQDEADPYVLSERDALDALPGLEIELFEVIAKAW